MIRQLQQQSCWSRPARQKKHKHPKRGRLKCRRRNEICVCAKKQRDFGVTIEPSKATTGKGGGGRIRQRRSATIDSSSSHEGSEDQEKSGATLSGTTRTVGLCTVVCKVTGLIREVTLTSMFGIGPVMDAFAYACVLPAYFQTVLGGVNGPFHTAVLVTMKKGQKDGKQKHLIESLSSWILLPACVLALLLYLFPSSILSLLAPGFTFSGPSGSLEMSIAAEQLRIMSPCVVTGVLTGIGFGALNASNRFLAPSISPAVANVVMISGLLLARGAAGCNPSSFNVMEVAAGRHLALAFVLGSASQLLLQALAMQRQKISRFFRIRLRLEDWKQFIGAMKIIVPTSISSTMLQLATYTDLWFASSWPGAAAIMGCGAMLITAPVGLLSNVIIVPRMPLLTQQAAEQDWNTFKGTCDRMLQASISVGLPLTISLLSFATQVVKVVYERSAFTSSSTLQVVPVVMVHALGITWFLGRDVIVRAFYAIDRGKIPAITSMVALALNAVLDAFFSKTMSLSAVGLVLSTVLVSVLSVLVLYFVLCRDLKKRPDFVEEKSNVWKDFLFGSMLASGITAVYCKWLLHVLPSVQLSLKKAFLAASDYVSIPSNSGSFHWLVDASLVGASFLSSWLLYYLVTILVKKRPLLKE